MMPRTLASSPRAASRAGFTALFVLLVPILFAARPAAADIDVRLDLGNAPAPPAFEFVAPPHRVYDASAGVYVVDDPDLGDVDVFQYGNAYWAFEDGYWYRAPSWRGDFTLVSPQGVPAALYQVPSYHWKHHPSWDSVYGGGLTSRPSTRTDWTTTSQEVRALPTPRPTEDWRNASYRGRTWNDRSWRQSQSTYVRPGRSREDRWRGPDVNASQTQIVHRHVVRRTVHADSRTDADRGD